MYGVRSVEGEGEEEGGCLKVNFALLQAVKAQRVNRHVTTLSLTSALDGGG